MTQKNVLEEPSETLRSTSSSMKLQAQWVVGFVDGLGCFYVGINPQLQIKAGYQVLPEFRVVQHERDVQVLYALKAFFGCGVVRRNDGNQMVYRVNKVEHLWQRIIPFFEKHPLKSRKRQEFLKFRRVILLMERGEHLTPEGMAKIQKIVQQMNAQRGRESPAPLETE
ncbi:MAG: LAGLIDADG family homing endonuclease [Armatimonadota bacterium]